MDISNRTAADTFDMEVIDPATGEVLLNDDKKPCSITLYGPGSKAFKAAQSATNAKLLERIKRKGKVASSPDEDDASRASFLTAITVSLNGFDYRGAADTVAIRAMYLDGGLGWIADQVNATAGDWQNFTQAAPSS